MIEGLEEQIELRSAAVTRVGDLIAREGWAFIHGREFKDAFSLDSGRWRSFSSYWSNLLLDEYMGDAGKYRYRRYSSVAVDTRRNTTRLLPHTAYMQPATINPLNGGVERQYEPLEPGFVSHPFFHALVQGLGKIFDHAAGMPGNWVVRLHPYRIIASEDELGKPTPEGLHRDGVDFIAMMLVARSSVTGGKTTITDSTGTRCLARR